MKKCGWQRPRKATKLRYIDIYFQHLREGWERVSHQSPDVFYSWGAWTSSKWCGWKPDLIRASELSPTNLGRLTSTLPMPPSATCYHPAQNHCQKKIEVRKFNKNFTSKIALQHLARTPAFIRPRHVKQSVFHLTWTVACRYPGQGGGRNPWRIYHSGAFRAMCSSQSS